MAEEIDGSGLADLFESMNDHTTCPDRPFTSQPHSWNGERGKTEVRGIRFRDLDDCLVKALVDSAPDVSDELRSRANDGTLNWNDLYDLDFSDVDPIAIVQNLGCRVEKVMGIYPNVPRLRTSFDGGD